LRVQEKPVERPWRFLKDLQILVGIMYRNIFLGRGDLHANHPELCDYDSMSESFDVSIDVHNSVSHFTG
jgi:hypothetical protein